MCGMIDIPVAVALPVVSMTALLGVLVDYLLRQRTTSRLTADNLRPNRNPRR